MRPAPLLIAAALGLLVSASLARAGDPSRAEYAADHDGIFWFLQLTDAHIGAIWPYQAAASLEWALGEGVSTIDPLFVVTTGDLCDSSFLVTQSTAQWEQYRGIVQDAGFDASDYYDLPGNHDQYGDAGLSFYLAYSIQGVATGQLYNAWTRSFPFGEYHFIGVNTPDLEGKIALFDQAGLGAETLAFVEEELEEHTDASLTFIFGHHPLYDFNYGADELVDLMGDYGVSAYGYGHTHSYAEESSGGVLYFNAGTLGKGGSDNVVVWAVDHDGLAVRAVDQESWPIAMITTPTAADLGGDNPWATVVPAEVADNPIRALVFGVAPLLDVGFRIDGGDWSALEAVDGPIWQGSFSTEGLAAGTHEVQLRAVSADGEGGHTIEIIVDTAACSDGVDNDGDGATDHPADPGCWGPFDNKELDPPVLPEPEPERVPEPGPEPVPEAAADEPGPEPLPDTGAPDEEAGTEPIPEEPALTEPELEPIAEPVWPEARPDAKVTGSDGADADVSGEDQAGADALDVTDGEVGTAAGATPAESCGGCGASGDARALPVILAFLFLAAARARRRRQAPGC